MKKTTTKKQKKKEKKKAQKTNKLYLLFFNVDVISSLNMALSLEMVKTAKKSEKIIIMYLHA